MTSPISTLPSELLLDIFALCLSFDPTCSSIFLPVCRFWSDLALGAPHLWQTLHLERPTRSHKSLLGQAECFLRLSQDLPFDVELDLLDEDGLDDVIPLLQPCFNARDVGRWKRCAVTWLGETTEMEFSTPLQNCSILEIFTRDPLDLSGLEPDPDQPEQTALEAQKSQILDYMPFFRQFPRPHELSLCASVFSLPIRISHPYTHLSFTRLIIVEDSSISKCHPRDLLSFLSHCPTLESFRWQAWPFEFSTMDRLPPMLTLPHLSTLEIISTLSLRHFLSCLDTPALDTLLLQNLNVHHPLPDLVDYAEDGDSDDEAGDFSQSPSSDHATGMALRGLLARSNPPIKTLEMDYVDLRTKDFVYCFERLKSLTHFRIVGSDMSNTVISLLRPRYTDGDGDMTMDNDTGIGTPSPAVPPTPPCLPNLRHLDLTGALRLSGDAIVSALRGRELFALSQPSMAISSLERVKVSRCPGMFPEHEQALTSIFESRFTTT
jgi:hypothetical protein